MDFANSCGDRLEANYETDKDLFRKIRVKVDSDGDGGARLALRGRVAEDVDDACGRNDDV